MKFFFLKLRDTYRLNKDQIILFFVCQVCDVHNLALSGTQQLSVSMKICTYNCRYHCICYINYIKKLRFFLVNIIVSFRLDRDQIIQFSISQYVSTFRIALSLYFELSVIMKPMYVAMKCLC